MPDTDPRTISVITRRKQIGAMRRQAISQRERRAIPYMLAGAALIVFGLTWVAMIAAGNIHAWWHFVPPMSYTAAVSVIGVPVTFLLVIAVAVNELRSRS